MESCIIRRRAGLQGFSTLICVLCLLGSLAGGCIVTAPSLVRLGAQETVLVINRGEAPKNVALSVTDHPAQAHLLFTESFVLAAGEQKLVHMKLDESKFSAEDFQANSSKHVSLRVQCDGSLDKQVLLLLSPQSGYLFLQTDRPMYRPTETVHVRVLAVDEALLPSNASLRLEIKNPQGIVSEAKNLWSSSQQRSSGMFSHNYELSKYAIYGEWKVTATYGQHENHKTEVSFHVEDYVLPTFGVRINVPKVLLPNARDHRVTVLARYVYGQPVKGTAIITVYVRNKTNHDVQFGTKHIATLSDGQAYWNLPVSELKNGDRWHDWVTGSRLFMRAAVAEEATAKQEVAVDSAAVFSNYEYSVSLEHARRDFKPGTRVVVVAHIREMDGKPASNVEVSIKATRENGSEVQLQSRRARSYQDGRALFPLRADASAQTINVTVCPTKHASDEEACASTVLVSYKSPVKAFVHINQDSSSTLLKIGDKFHTYIYTSPENKTVYYQVTSRGKTLVHGKAESDQVSFDLTEKMAPNFRLLVFSFHKGHIVADSQDFKMQETCTHESQITVHSDLDGKEPGAEGTISIKGEPHTTVGLLAVDKAVYLLSDAGQLTTEKLFRTLRSHDLTCGPGGGVTSGDVFADAGVVVITAEDTDDLIPTENSCAAKLQRHRRELRGTARMENDPFFRRCCEVGTLPDRLRRHCSTREEIIRRHFNSPRGHRCADAFARCCATAFGGFRTTDMQRARSDSNLNPNENPLEEQDISQLQPRLDFMHTWLFTESTTGADGWYNFTASTPHSVTTWSIEAVAVSPKGGVCVARPGEAKVFRNVFLQVTFPPTVVRNEQVEIVATLFNYGSDALHATVSLHGAPGLCTGSQHAKLPDRKQLNVERHSGASVSFSVVPLRQGKFPIKVEARSSGGSDLLQKTLVVVPEGIPVEETFSVTLDPSNERRRKARAVLKRGCRDVLDEEHQRQVVTITPFYPRDTVPNTESCSVSVIGSEASALTEAVISNVDSLISMPMGCGEQNMMIMAPVLYAYKYLKSKKKLNESMVNTALTYLRKGYEQELTFRNDNGSFSTFQNGPGNVWLTAFVLRVFCEARNVIDISPDVIQSGLSWLASKQQADGSFEERDPILHRELLGSVHGTTAMTAFVLLTFHECSSTSAPIPQVAVSNTTSREAFENRVALREQLGPGTQPSTLSYADANGHTVPWNGRLTAITVKETHASVARAQFYLSDRLEAVKHPYVAALVAYSLSFVPGADRQKSMEVLTSHLLEDTEMNTLSTGNEATGVDVEGTSYALLTHLKHRDMDTSKRLVTWLERHRSASGSFVSTQDTVVALQALSEFSIKASNAAPNISVSVVTDNMMEEYAVNKDSASVLKEFHIINANGQIIVNATGVGAAALNVRLRYNVLIPPEKVCKFSLNVTAEIDDGVDKDPEEFSGTLMKKLGVDKGHVSRNRVGRSTGSKSMKPASKRTYRVKVCTRYLGGRESDMAIVDVGIFTGFSPVEEDLKTVRQDTPGVQKYELKEKSVIFYLTTIKSEKEICIAFRTKEDFTVTNFQTATVKVYDFYKPKDSCSKFYRPGPTSSLVGLFCEGNQCKCATEECPVNETFEGVFKKSKRAQVIRSHIAGIACNEHDFVWRGKVVDKYVLAGYRHIAFKIDLVIKEGEENASVLTGNVRLFRGRELCNATDLDKGIQYIIFGKDSDQRITDENTSIRYPLNHEVRIYDERTVAKKRKIISAFQWMVQRFAIEGCQQ